MTLKDKAERALENTVYYFWVGVGLTLGAISIVRIVLHPAKDSRVSTARP